MSSGCPACNGLSELRQNCPDCGEEMEDMGAVSDYLGPYSPYQDRELLDLTVPDAQEHDWGECVHLLFCPNCGRDHRQRVETIPLPE
ncbi:MAG: hypothetical protein HPY81_08590 [Firmicutes bacterium]|nr:hypothetical protein [Bacillota bacterium]